MINLYLSNPSLIGIDPPSLENLLIELNKINSKCEKHEKIFMNENIYSIILSNNQTLWELAQNFQNKQFLNTVLASLMASLTQINDNLNSDDEIDNCFRNQLNGFYGFDFSKLTDISKNRQSTNHNEYKIFKYSFIHLDKNIIWDNKEKLFPKTVFTSNVDDDSRLILSHALYYDFIESLIILDKFCTENEITNNSHLTQIQQGTSLKISPEGETTLTKFDQPRLKNIPNGKTILFNYHIKVNDGRIYFHIEDKIYIGHIGKHLPTKKHPK